MGQECSVLHAYGWDTLKVHVWQKPLLQNKFTKLINTLGSFVFIIFASGLHLALSCSQSQCRIKFYFIYIIFHTIITKNIGKRKKKWRGNLTETIGAYLNNRVFLSRNYRLKMLVLRTSNFQGVTIRPIVPRHKHSIVFIVHH